MNPLDRGAGRDDQVGSAADAARPEHEHRHHRPGRTHGRSAVPVAGETKASRKAHATIGKHHRTTLKHDQLEGKVKQELVSMNENLKTVYAKVKAIRHSNGRISFELKLDRPFVRDPQTRFGAMPADVTRMIGPFLGPRDKKVAAAGAIEMERTLGAPPPQDLSLREFRKQAKHDAASIIAQWDDSISRQVLTAYPPNTQEVWIVLSADGKLKSIDDAWDRQPDLERGEVLIKLQKHLRYKDQAAEEKEAIELLAKHRPHDARIQESKKDMMAMDSAPAWEVENFDGIANPGIKAKVGLMVDFLNLKMTNNQIRQ